MEEPQPSSVGELANLDLADLDLSNTSDLLSPVQPSKIRCLDCEHLVQRRFCPLKGGIKVSRKKLHDCELFEPRPNKDPRPDRRVSATAKQDAKRARRMLRKLAEKGQISMNEDGTVRFEDLKIGDDGRMYQRQTIDVPKTTASPGILGTETLHTPGLADQSKAPQDE